MPTKVHSYVPKNLSLSIVFVLVPSQFEADKRVCDCYIGRALGVMVPSLCLYVSDKQPANLLALAPFYLGSAIECHGRRDGSLEPGSSIFFHPSK